MRFAYRLFRYYKYYSGTRLIFDLCLIAIIFGCVFYFFDKNAMVGFFTNNLKTEVSKLKSAKRSYASDITRDSSGDAVLPSRIPKSCFSSDTRGCVCYDQHTIIISDFPVSRCYDIDRKSVV